MANDARPQDNSERLLKHLSKNSLAARLVEAHRSPNATDPVESIKAVIKARLEQVRENLDGTEG